MQSGLNPLKKFIPNNYYRDVSINRSIILEDKTYVFYSSPSFEGGKLITDYYADKYQARIYLHSTLHSSYDSKHKESRTVKTGEDFFKLLQMLCTLSQSYRQAFLFSFGEDHTETHIFIRENNENAYLIADSMGTSIEKAGEIAGDLKKLGITVYYVKDKRQADDYSCHVDGLVFSRQAVGIDPKTNQFIIEGLSQKLKDGSTKKDENLYEVLLPPSLAFFAQYGSFRNKHGVEFKKIPKMDRHIKSGVKNNDINFKDEVKNYNLYLTNKGLKYLNIMEIQFYLAQIAKQLDPRWIPDVRKDFIKKAKEEFKAQGPLHKGFLREGLHDFAEQYLVNLLKSVPEKLPKKVVGNPPLVSKSKCSLFSENVSTFLGESLRQIAISSLSFSTTPIPEELIERSNNGFLKK